MQDGDEDAETHPGESQEDPQKIRENDTTRFNKTAAPNELAETAAASGGAAPAGGDAQPGQPGDLADEEEIIECPVPGCGVQYRIGAMSNLRSKVCNMHQKMDHFPIDGVDHRYCHQCYKLHPLDQFTGNKRSCTLRLERHNLRRRLNRLYKKSCTKEGTDGEAGSFSKPDRNKAAVDLAMQIMSATHQEEVSTSKKAGASSSKRAAASKALQVAVSAAKASAAATSEAAPDGSSSGRDQDDPLGGVSEVAKTKADNIGFAEGFPGRRLQATGGISQPSAYGSIHNTCEMCGGLGCPSCPGMSRAARDYSQGPMRPPARGAAASHVPADAQNIDSYLNEYDRYYSAPPERAAVGPEAATGSKRGCAAGPMMGPEGLQQPQLQRGGSDVRTMPGQPEAGSPPGLDARRRGHSDIAGPCYACRGFGCPNCSRKRYAQQVQPMGGRDVPMRYPAPEARGVGARPPPTLAAGIRGEVRQPPGEGNALFADRQQAIGSSYSGLGQAQPFLRTPQGRPVYNISMKLFGNATPAMLPPDLREEFLSWLETAPRNLDGYLREGCVHLSIDLTFSTDEDYASAIQSVPAGFLASVYSAKAKWPWCKCPTTVWLPDRVIHAEEGEIVANAPRCQSNSLELISAEVVTHRSIESNKVCRFLSLRSYDLKVPGVTVLLRSPVDGWWQKLAAYCQETKELATSIGLQTCGSGSNSKSGSTESGDTCFEVLNGGVRDVTCSVEVPDHVAQDGLAFVEIVVDGDVGQHRQSRPIAVLLQQPQHEPVAV